MEYQFIIACVVTKNCLDEFLLLRKSFEQYYRGSVEWFVSCDQTSYKALWDASGVRAYQLIDINDDKSNHVSLDPEEINAFYEIIYTKMTIMKKAMAAHPNRQILFLDTDIIFTNPFEAFALRALEQTDAIVVCPHHTNSAQIEERHGRYNVGMFAVPANKMGLQFIENWEALTRTKKFYFEQKPFEVLLKNYPTFELPINYNIGWWRFNSPSTQPRLELLSVSSDSILFGDRPAVCFHLHTKKQKTAQLGKFLLDKLQKMMEDTDNHRYKELLNEIGT